MVLACMLGGMAAAGTGSGVVGVIVTILVGAICGLINGLMIAKAKISEMITTQRGYQANTRIITVTDSMLEELVNMKR